MKTLSMLSFAALCGVSLPLAAQNIERMRLTDGDLSCTQIFAEVQQMDTMIRVMGSAPAAAPAAAPVAGAAAGNAALPSGFNPFGALGNVQAASVGQASNAQVQALMLASSDPRVRAAAYDPAAVAQTAAMLQNPQLAVAAQRAAAAGVNPAMIQGQLNSVAMAQQAANAFQANSQANAQAAAPAAPAAPAVNALGGLFGALAGARGGSGGAQAASLFGSLTQNAGQAQAQAPAAVAPQAAAPAASQGNAIVAQAQGRKEHLTSLFLNKGCKMSEVQR